MLVLPDGSRDTSPGAALTGGDAAAVQVSAVNVIASVIQAHVDAPAETAASV